VVLLTKLKRLSFCLPEKSSCLVVVDQMVVSIGNFLVVVLLARFLGVDDFGRFTIAWLILLFSSSLVMAVVVFPMLSTAPQLKGGEKKEYIVGCIGSYLFGSAIWVFVGVVAYVLSSHIESGGIRTLIFPLIVCVVFVNLQEVCRRSLVALNKMRLVLISDVVTYGGRFILVVAFGLFDGLSIEIGLWLCAGSSVFGVLVCASTLGFQGGLYSCTITAWRTNKGSAKWLLPSGVMQWTSINLFVVCAAYLIGPASVATLRVCQSLLSVFNVLIQGLENLIPPKASLIYSEGGKSALKNYLVRCSLVGTLPFLGLIVFSFLWGEFVVVAIYGGDYENITSILTIYSISYVFMYLVVPVRAGLRTIGKTKIWFLSYLVSSLFSICLVYYLETTYFLVGAVSGMLIANIIIIAISSAGLRTFLLGRS